MNPVITAWKGAKASLVSGLAFVAGSYIAPLIGVDQQVVAGIVTTVITGLTTSIINYIKNRKR